MKLLYALLLLGMGGVASAYAASPDRSFYIKAAAGGLEEVAGGKLAQERGGSEAVKNFGAKMVQDHSAANAKLATLAAAKNVKLPKSPDAKQRALLQKLAKKSGASFDEAYIKEEIVHHQATVALMEKEISSGKDAEAKAFAQETLPVVKEHLSMLQSMQAGSGMPGSGAMGSRPATQGTNAPGASQPGGMSPPASSSPGSTSRPNPGAP